MTDNMWRKMKDEILYLSSVFCPLTSVFRTYRVVYVKINITNGKKKSRLKDYGKNHRFPECSINL